MAVEFAVTLDDGELWIPSDIFPAEDREVQEPNHHRETHRENHRQLPVAGGAPAFAYQNPSPRPPIPERIGRFGPGPIMTHFVPISPALRGPPLGFPRPPVHPQAIPIRPAQRLIETRVPCNYNNRPPVPVHGLPLQSQIGPNRAQNPSGPNRAQNPSGPNRVPRNRPPRSQPQNRLLPFQATAGAVYILGGRSTNNNCRGAYLGTGVFIPMPTSIGYNLFFRTRRHPRDNRRGQCDAGREEGDTVLEQGNSGGELRDARDEQRDGVPQQGDAGGEQRDAGGERRDNERELGNDSGPISQTNNQEQGSNNAESSIIPTNSGQNTNQTTNTKAGKRRVVPEDEPPVIKEKGESSSSSHRKPSRKIGCIEKATEEYYSLPKEWTY